jgi:hypothetical protein
MFNYKVDKNNWKTNSLYDNENDLDKLKDRIHYLMEVIILTQKYVEPDLHIELKNEISRFQREWFKIGQSFYKNYKDKYND